MKHRAQCVSNHLLLHDRAGTFASLLYKAEKCLSVRLSASRDNLGGFSMDRLGTYFVHS